MLQCDALMVYCFIWLNQQAEAPETSDVLLHLNISGRNKKALSSAAGQILNVFGVILRSR